MDYLLKIRGEGEQKGRGEKNSWMLCHSVKCISRMCMSLNFFKNFFKYSGLVNLYKLQYYLAVKILNTDFYFSDFCIGL